jgi:hypothetical protein
MFRRTYAGFASGSRSNSSLAKTVPDAIEMNLREIPNKFSKSIFSEASKVVTKLSGLLSYLAKSTAGNEKSFRGASLFI